MEVLLDSPEAHFADEFMKQSFNVEQCRSLCKEMKQEGKRRAKREETPQFCEMFFKTFLVVFGRQANLRPLLSLCPELLM
eukprot:3953770-Amphidinium_carterae.1